MKIYATFVWPNYADGPELANAWDELMVDVNYEGYRKERAEAIASYRDELDPSMVRDVTLTVDGASVNALFATADLNVAMRPGEAS